MKIVSRIICCCLLAALSACNPVSDAFVVIQLDGKSWDAQSALMAGEIYRMRVITESNGDLIERVTVKSFDNTHGDVLILDTTFTTNTLHKEVNYNWEAPLYEDTTNLEIKAVALIGGRELTYSYPVRILPSDRGLRKIDNITMYSAKSGKQSAFSMIDLQTLFPDTLRNDSLCFFDHSPVVSKDDQTVSPSERDSLYREWISYKGLYFARFENFNFNEAQISDLQQAYKISLRNNIISDLRYDDVILIGTKTDVLAAVKILLVADDPGTKDDRYVFSMKAIQKKQKK